MSDIDSAGSVASVTLEVDYDLTIAHASKFHALLVGAFKDSDEVVLKLGEEITVDLSGLQILYAARQLAARTGKSLSWAKPPPSSIEDAACACGIDWPRGGE